MAVQTVAGTIIGLSASQPSTYNEVGYEALTYTSIGEITDGGSHGRAYAEVIHSPIASRGLQKFKGSFNEGTKTLQLATSGADAGQVMLKTALLSDNDYSFEVLYQNGAIQWFQAKVMSYETAATGVDTIVSATVTLSITTNSAGVGIVEHIET